MASGSPGCNPSDPDDLLRSGARPGLKRELARILRYQADSTLSRTRSGDSSASNRHTLNKRAKKSPLAADQSLILSPAAAAAETPILSPAAATATPILSLAAFASPILLTEVATAATSNQNEMHVANLDRSQTTAAAAASPILSPASPILSPEAAAAAAATSIQNEMHAANPDRSQMTTAEIALLATPRRRFTRSALAQRPSIAGAEEVAGEGDPAAGSKTNVDEQAIAVLEIPGDGSNLQTSVFTPGPSNSSEKHRVKFKRSRSKKQIDEDGAVMALLATRQRFTRSALVQIPSIAGEGDPAAGSKTNVDKQGTTVLEIPGDGSKQIDDDGAGMALLAIPGRRFTRSTLVQTPSIAGEGDPAAGLKINVDEKERAVLEIQSDGTNMQTSVFTPDPIKSSKKQRVKSLRSRSKKQIDEDGGGALLGDSVSVVPEKLEKVNVGLQTPVTAVGEDGSGAVPIPVSMVAQGKYKFTRSKKKTDEDGCGALNADNVVLEKSEKGDVEALKRTDEDGNSEHKVLARRFTRSALNTPIPKIDWEMSTEKETPTAKLDGDECNVSNMTPGKRVLRSTRSTVETLAAKHDGDECKVSYSTPGKRVLRSMRSTVETPVVKHDEEFKADDSTLGKHVDSFTRSALKPPIEDSDSESESTETDTSESSDFEESKSRHKPRKTPKKKMELKMSKKIGLTKLPANLRDLFATGLLEGYPVTYNCNNKQQISLEGVIRGNMISCNCPSCKGSKTFSGYNWEVHAGSNKKHPSDHIFLENGKSLHDVLKACMSAPLNNLEATIQNVIGAPPRERLSICQTCGVSFCSSQIGEPAPSCDSCLKTEQLRLSNETRSIGISARIGSLPDSCNSASLSSSSHNYGRITKKDIGLHKLVFMDDILPEGTEVSYYHRGERLLDGYIKDSAIYCLHCNVVVKPSVFEAHAGRGTRRKPFHNIYTSNGVSLHELSVSLSKDRKLSAHENDDLCNICNDGGDLLLCDVCPRAFHRGCLGLLEVPEGDWHCPPCQTMHQKERFVEYNDNAIAAGRVHGVDPIEQIIKRCIRIFTSPGTAEGGCVLCRLHDFSKAAFGDRTVLICDQCEKEYHVGCLREHNMCDLNALPEGDWFCCADCQRINSALQELLLRGQEPLKDLDADIIRKKQNEKDLSKDGFDVSWRLLSGKTASADSRLLLSETVSLFSEAFDPIVGATGQDLIPSIVNGENMGDQDFRGMYCVVLTSNSHIVSAGILRILGSELAELPLVATSREAQGQGYFQALFSCIERLLGSWNVKHFVLPAAEEALSIWTNKFGFTKIASDQLREYAKGVHPMVFHGTSMLYKPVPRYQHSS